MKNTTNTQTWKPRRSTTITRIANELSTIQIYEGEFKTRAYDRFDGFLAGLQYMHLLNDSQVLDLRDLGMRARDCKRVPLPEGDELRALIGNILFETK